MFVYNSWFMFSSLAFYLVYVSLFVVAIWKEKCWWGVCQEDAVSEVKFSSNTKHLRF